MFRKRGQQRWSCVCEHVQRARCYQQWQPIDISSLDDGVLLPVVVETDLALVCGGGQEPVLVSMVDLGSGSASLRIIRAAISETVDLVALGLRALISSRLLAIDSAEWLRGW
ncbi:hypothetical protein T492DRAFT_1113798 [Pavlovales sp. CCMP2436]|nr:hypothetical protein T492DRAFT_1113798 [Pavlovales sp. CCMP2436]